MGVVVRPAVAGEALEQGDALQAQPLVVEREVLGRRRRDGRRLVLRVRTRHGRNEIPSRLTQAFLTVLATDSVGSYLRH